MSPNCKCNGPVVAGSPDIAVSTRSNLGTRLCPALPSTWCALKGQAPRLRAPQAQEYPACGGAGIGGYQRPKWTKFTRRDPKAKSAPNHAHPGHSDQRFGDASAVDT